MYIIIIHASFVPRAALSSTKVPNPALCSSCQASLAPALFPLSRNRLFSFRALKCSTFPGNSKEKDVALWEPAAAGAVDTSTCTCTRRINMSDFRDYRTKVKVAEHMHAQYTCNYTHVL